MPGSKDASCIDVCPVDCIHPSPNELAFGKSEQFYIYPDECIDCDVCEPAYLVTSIFQKAQVPEEWKKYIKINADYFNKR